MVMLIPVLALATIVGVVGLVISGFAHVVMGVIAGCRKQRSLPWLVMGALQLLLVVLLTAAPFVAADRAERSNDWVDDDGDGMLDPMANGSYDWVDVNGGDFAVAWGALSGGMVAPVALALYVLSKSPGVASDQS
jgi:hypothetical protein